MAARSKVYSIYRSGSHHDLPEELALLRSVAERPTYMLPFNGHSPHWVTTHQLIQESRDITNKSRREIERTLRLRLEVATVIKKSRDIMERCLQDTDWQCARESAHSSTDSG